MTRKKVQLNYIACDAARKSTFKKRKKGILKKIDELTTLCGVEACAVIISPYEPEPVMWPNKEQARTVVERFRKMPEMDQHRKMYDQPGYLRGRVTKLGIQLNRIQRENREKEVALTMYGAMADRVGLEGLSVIDLNDLGWMIERTIKEIGLKIDALRRREGNNNDNDNNPEVAAVGLEQVAQEAPPMFLPQSGYVGLRTEEVGPGLGHFLGLGFGNGEMHLPPGFWPMGQYYQLLMGGYDGPSSSGRGFDGASSSGGGFDGASSSGAGAGAGDDADNGAGDNMPPSFNSFFH